MPKQLTQHQVRDYIRQQGYILLSSYVNSTTKLDLQCPKGHRFQVLFGNFKHRGSRCPICAGNQPLTHEYVKGYIERHEYKLLSNKYEGVHVRLLIQCKQGHRYKTTFANFETKPHCPFCSGRKVSYEQVKGFVERKGSKLISTEYRDQFAPLIVECKRGHQRTTNWRALNQSGVGCRQCVSEKQRIAIEKIQEVMRQDGYSLVTTEYQNAHQKLLVRCNRGHKYRATWNKFSEGSRCPECHESRGEEEVAKILKLAGIKYTRQHRIEQYKIDFYIPTLNVAIEYDGIQHFRPVQFGGVSVARAQKEFVKVQKRDQRKNELCKTLSINLLRIPYTEKNIKEKVLTFIERCTRENQNN